jgi:hypothetical protein
MFEFSQNAHTSMRMSPRFCALGIAYNHHSPKMQSIMGWLCFLKNQVVPPMSRRLLCALEIICLSSSTLLNHKLGSF